MDEHAPLAIRTQIPRVLRLIRDPRSVEVLIGCLNSPNQAIRTAVVKGLNRLRQSAPHLEMAAAPINEQIRGEATECFRLHALIDPLRAASHPRAPSALLVRTLETRFGQSMERLFRLLGLRYSPNEIYNTYLSLQSGNADRVTAAHDYLDSLLERDLKRVVIPLLDASHHHAHARDVFGVQAKTLETALRELLGSNDPWITACAIATAAEFKLKALAADISKAGAQPGTETFEVARAASTVLA